MKTKIITSMVLLVLNVKAQDVTFSQFNSVPLYFNPAFAGSVEKSRLALSYRNQWSSAYQTYYLSYDQAIKKLHGGVGLISYNDNEGEGVINTFYTALVYAPKFNVTNKIAVSPAVKIGYRRGSVNSSKLTFGDQIDPNRGLIYPSNEPALISRNSIDISSGLVINTENFYAGFSVDHLNNPNISNIKGSKSLLPEKYVIQLGYTYQENDSADYSILSSALYENQAGFNLFQFNLLQRYKWAMVGIGWTSENTYIAMIGYYSKKLVIGYSYDLYYGDIYSGKSFTAHEVSLKYFFTIKKKKGRS
jgi:type IX secretion system PorP/SprF family membrane protein